MRTKTLIIVAISFLLISAVSFIACSGDGEVPTVDVDIALRLNFPDGTVAGSSATTKSVVPPTELPDSVTKVTLLAVSENPVQVEEYDVALDSLTAVIPLKSADFDFYVHVEGTTSYVATNTTPLPWASDTLTLEFDLNEGAPPEIGDVTIQTVDADDEAVLVNSTLSLSLRTTLHYKAARGNLVMIVVKASPDLSVDELAKEGHFHKNSPYYHEEDKGFRVLWVAPNEVGVYLVFVRLTDSKGGAKMVKAIVTIEDAKPELDFLVSPKMVNIKEDPEVMLRCIGLSDDEVPGSKIALSGVVSKKDDASNILAYWTATSCGEFSATCTYTDPGNEPISETETITVTGCDGSEIVPVPTTEPTGEPTAEPTEEPTAEPTEEPTVAPTEVPDDGLTGKTKNFTINWSTPGMTTTGTLHFNSDGKTFTMAGAGGSDPNFSGKGTYSFVDGKLTLTLSSYSLNGKSVEASPSDKWATFQGSLGDSGKGSLQSDGWSVDIS
ncbi:PT domain-containing protein [Oligoflexia bacterium]|nr:PT domain-containing protein [Oligoflexia bacterium]